VTERFVSEPLIPDPAAIDVTGMAAGVPGLPRRFTWDGKVHEVARVLAQWREAGPERGRRGPEAERYLRRHWWHVVTTGGLEVKFYCERQPRGARRWWVYSVTDGSGPR
jgi:hypothetical protein